MFQLIPAPLHRAVLRAAHALRRMYWRRFRPRVDGVSIVARDAKGRVLLVRHSYGRRDWRLPGGGIGRGEDPETAALREFTEELGCTPVSLRPVGIREEALYGATNRLHIFEATTEEEPVVDGRELTEARFFELEDLPDGRHTAVRTRINMALR